MRKNPIKYSVTAGFPNFKAYVEVQPSEGLGADIELIRNLVSNDVEARDLLDQVLPGRHRGDRGTDGKINNVNLATKGNTEAYALSRLRKQHPELHAKVLSGELSAHKSAVKPGSAQKWNSSIGCCCFYSCGPQAFFKSGTLAAATRRSRTKTEAENRVMEPHPVFPITFGQHPAATAKTSGTAADTPTTGSTAEIAITRNSVSGQHGSTDEAFAGTRKSGRTSAQADIGELTHKSRSKS